MIQKIIKTGNSLAVILPNSFVKATGLKAGEKVIVETHIRSDLMQIRTQDSLATGITPEFKKWVEDFKDRYGSDLQELEKR